MWAALGNTFLLIYPIMAPTDVLTPETAGEVFSVQFVIISLLTELGLNPVELRVP